MSLLAPGRRFVGPVWSAELTLLAYRLLLGICLEQFHRLPVERQQLLLAVDVDGDTYTEAAARLGVYRHSLPQQMFGARHQFYAGVQRRLADLPPWEPEAPMPGRQSGTASRGVGPLRNRLGAGSCPTAGWDLELGSRRRHRLALDLDPGTRFFLS